MDTGRRSELLAADLTVGEIADYLKVDSLAYLELDRLVRATETPKQSFCAACLTGDYPVPIPDVADAKLVLEETSDSTSAQETTSTDISIGVPSASRQQ